MLHELIVAHRADIITRTRAKVAARPPVRPADAALDAGIPVFLDQLIAGLRGSASQDPMLSANAARHGGDLLRLGFSVSQVVHGYGDVCQAVTELALERDTLIPTNEFRVFNRCLDEAIASAVTEYGRQREAGISRQGTERLAVLAHELRNSLSPALLALGTLRRGASGPDGSTGAILDRSLLRLRALIDRSLSEVRLEAGVVHLERISMTSLIRDVLSPATVQAGARGVRFDVAAVDARLEVEADRQLLIGALENLLQNAFKFTRRGGHVWLTVREAVGQILIDVGDECGGLPAGRADQLFAAFEQHGADRTGLGLGLWISRASLLTMNGRLSVQDLPGKGCVFTATLPRLGRSPSATSS